MTADPTEPAPPQPPLVRPFVSGPSAAEPTPRAAGDPVAMVVRPYLLTGGRATSAEADIEIEAQISTTASGSAALPELRLEHRDIVALCRQPLAIAEIATRLGLHLGVVRILVGDLMTDGHVTARRPYVGAHRNVAIIERVINGLQAIG